MLIGEAQRALLGAGKRCRRLERVAPVFRVRRVERRAMVARQGEEGTDRAKWHVIDHVPRPRPPRRLDHLGRISAGAPPKAANCAKKYPGDDLFSQGVAPRVSSALESLTSVFGMGTGGSSPLASPG